MLTTSSTKHFLELFEYVTEWVLSLTSPLSASLPKLIVEPFELGEPLSAPAERLAACYCSSASIPV